MYPQASQQKGMTMKFKATMGSPVPFILQVATRSPNTNRKGFPLTRHALAPHVVRGPSIPARWGRPPYHRAKLHESGIPGWT